MNNYKKELRNRKIAQSCSNINKYCGYCNKILPIVNFGLSNVSKDGYTSVCFKCKPKRTEMQKIYRKKQNIINRLRNKKLELVISFGNKCAKCNNSFPPECYDFHHKNPDTKDLSISSLMTRNKKRMYTEADKCVMLCANCHRTIHFYLKSKQYEVQPWEL